MMTRSQTRIAQLEEEKEFYKDLHEGFAYKLFLKEKELQARIVELEKENEKLSGKYSDLWHYGCNDDLGEADIVEMLLAKGEKKRVMDVWSDVYEDCDHFEFNEDSEDENEDTDEDYYNRDQIPDTEESEECARCKKTFRYYLHDCTCDDCFDFTYFVCKDCEYKMEGCGICGKK